MLSHVFATGKPMTCERAVSDLLVSLRSESGISGENQVLIEKINDAFATSYRDHILTIIVPLVWKLRVRIASVAKPRSEAELVDAIGYFRDAQFADRATQAVRGICDAALQTSLDRKSRGFDTQESGLALFFLNRDILDGELYPGVHALLATLSEKARAYHPSRDRSFIRLIGKFQMLVDEIEASQQR